MTQRYAELSARLSSVGQLDAVVAAMRGMAAARAQQSRKHLDSVRAYADTIAGAIAQALALLPDAARPERRAGQAHGLRLCVLFGAEQGFAGAFSEHVFAAAEDLFANPNRPLLVVGSRAARLAQARGRAPQWSAPMVAQASAAAGLAERIARAVTAHLGNGVQGADMVYARPEGGSRVVVERRSLLPLDWQRFAAQNRAAAPLLNLPPQALLEALGGEYLFAQLSEAILHSFAAENSARLQAMSAARDNIGRRLEDLGREQRQARQEEITAELIELATGAEAVRARTQDGAATAAADAP